MAKNAIRYPICENSYNKEIKRFINRDVVSGEITNSGSLNRYCYVQGNPVSLTDPFGLCPDSNSAFKNLCNNLYHMDWSAVGHAALDVAGIFFDGADVINAIWYACEGNMEMAAASAVCAIPALGLATGNLLMKSNKLAAAGKAVKAIAKMTQGVMGVCAGIEMAKTGFTNFMDGLEAGTFDAGALLQTLGGIGIAMLSGKGLASSGRELQACTGNSGKTMKGTLLDADISWEPVESGGKPVATPNSGQGFSSRGYNPKPGERTIGGYVKQNATPEISLYINSGNFNNSKGNIGGQFKRIGAEEHFGLSPHVHQPLRNITPDGTIYGSTGKTVGVDTLPPNKKDVKQLYEYINNGKYHK